MKAKAIEKYLSKSLKRRKINISENNNIRTTRSKSRNLDKLNNITTRSNLSIPKITIKNDNTDSEYSILQNQRLKRDFFICNGVELAKKLLGKIIVKRVDNKIIRARIVETEAYMGVTDKGSHSYGNKNTERVKRFYKSGGHLYVYMIYGISNCMNILANDETTPEAVLIRAVEPLEGIDLIKQNRSRFAKKEVNFKNLVDLTNGPGKVAASLAIDRENNGLDLCNNDDMFVIDDKYKYKMERSVRINIEYAEEFRFKPWRFYIKDNKYVSKVKIVHKYIDDE